MKKAMKILLIILVIIVILIKVRVWYPKNYDDSDTKLPVVIASHGSC